MYQNIKLAGRSAKASADQPVALFLFEGVGKSDAALPPGYAAIDAQTDGAITKAIGRPGFSSGVGEVTLLYPSQGPKCVLLTGLGKSERFQGDTLRIAAGKLAKKAFAEQISALRVSVLPGVAKQLSDEQAAAALGDGVAIARLDFDTFKGAAKSAENGKKPKRLDLTLHVEPAIHKAVGDALIVGQAVETARRLAATPPNVANPAYLVDACRKLARRVGLGCTVIDAKRAAELNMGGLTAVGRGGSSPPALICLEYVPAGKAVTGKKRSTAGDHGKPIMLVGKAVTFDTGGYSLKVGGSMKGMKYDKCGGMAVIGAMEAVARLKLPQRVVGVIPTAENMIDHAAYRVDDILTMHNGVTVEVTNTDAEGRLILADALAYGTKQYQPAAVIDLATLTGGVVVALGSYCAGAFATDDALFEQVRQAGEFSGERIWRLPLWDEHRDLMKSAHADILNSAERKAHPIQGAAFLSYFVGGEAARKMPTLPWVHLDIAGVADVEADTALFPKGPTGFGVRLLTRLVETWRG